MANKISWKSPGIGYDYMAYMDYMDLTIRCPRKAVRKAESLTHYLGCN